MIRPFQTETTIRKPVQLNLIGTVMQAVEGWTVPESFFLLLRKQDLGDHDDDHPEICHHSIASASDADLLDGDALLLKERRF